MKTVRSPKAMQSLAARWRREGHKIVLVPTMGGLHNGHLSLIRRGRKAGDRLVVSIFVNPTQFGPREDFSRYPRTFTADRRKCMVGGADAVFCPDDAAMYPDDFETWVNVDFLSSVLEGAVRSTHFRGVCTVVLKLLNIVTPDIAVFGQKDYQQLTIIRRMVDDLNLPVRLVIGPIVREPGGLALSSRNAYLSPAQRESAEMIYRSLCWIKDEFDRGKRRTVPLVRRVKEMIGEQPGFKLEYLEFADPATLKKQGTITPPTVVLIAARIGETRLIDNILIS